MNSLKIIQINTAYATPVLVKNGENSFLVDTGRKNFGNKILRTIKSNGLKPSDIKLIILTHTHFDHTGNVKFLKEKTGAKIVVHKNEMEFLKRGYTDIPYGTMPSTNFISKIGRKFLPFIGKYKPANPDIIVDEKLDLTPYGISGHILHTPGHTDGSQSVIIGDTIISGDVFFNGGLPDVFPPFANNPELLLKTWEKLLKLGIKTIYSGHGPKFNVEKVKESLAKKKLLTAK